MDKYIFIRELGRGTYGRVCLMRNKECNTFEAIKFIHRSNSNFALNEVKNHIICSYHPNVIKFNNIIFSDEFICLSLEYAERGDMFDYLKTLPNRRFSEDVAKPIFKQILNALFHCHSLGVSHRDIKLENILINGMGHIKLCDFGYASESDEYNPDRILGSLSYLAPECVLKKVEDCTKLDIWSCGVVLFCMLCGHYPFEDPSDPNNIKKHIINICEAKYTLPLHLSQDATSLLKTILTPDPSKRPSALELLNNDWLLC